VFIVRDKQTFKGDKQGVRDKKGVNRGQFENGKRQERKRFKRGKKGIKSKKKGVNEE